MNILVLSSVYKDDSLGLRDTSTNIVNSFVAEWMSQGHRVVVIHNAHCYPRIIHMIPSAIKKKLASKMGFAIADYDAVEYKEYMDGGAKVFRIPIRKYKPHQSPSNKQIERQTERIKSILLANEFEPDVITGHWASPQMEILAKLKSIYNCTTAIVLHGTGYIDNPSFCADRYLTKIDRIGARSESQARQIKELLKLDELPFVCSSGVPDKYVDQYCLNTDKFDKVDKWRFAYVGRLVSYKNIDVTIRALTQMKDLEWEFNIIGDGAIRSSLEDLCRDLGCSDRVNFLGRVSRNEVMKLLSETHFFVMLSTNEVFGLVYLEAMAASCITIASKNGGVDGIIIDGLNGYLCEEGNEEELVNLLRTVVSRKTELFYKIAQNGYDTVQEYKDSIVAKKYLTELQK